MEIEDQENSSTASSRKTPQQRKAVYRKLLNEVEDIQEVDQLSLDTVNKLDEILQEVHALDHEIQIEERVGNADETLLDFMVLSSASKLLHKYVERLDVYTSTYEPGNFAQNVVSYISTEDDQNPTDITLLLNKARKVIPKVPEYRYVYGTYDINNLPIPKQKKERQKIVKEKLIKKEPEKVTNLDQNEESIEQTVKMLYEILEDAYTRNQRRSINYYDYIIDTTSYSSTIENMFHFSFLIRDGRAQLELDNKGTPLIKPIKKKVLTEFRADGGKNAQIIVCITMDIWERYEKEGLIQHRKKRGN
ncbi:non-structural maintenance of chromosomes element 4 homolog A-like [Euwallacea fornicatus]|uniref:non-structural maintenance of chromosomes element 4 homolog A-like n=1 Tax=Euwallacea fornicatus TaxID=995702 RepID=UPI00338D933A